MPQRHLAWPACFNTRDMGGLPIEGGGHTRGRTLLRSDNLCRLTEEGQQALRDYGVRTIIDLRLPAELEKDPNPFARGQEGGTLRYLNLPLLDEADSEGEAAMRAQPMATQYLIMLDRYRSRIARIIKAVAAAERRGGVLVHCHSGKDRTGIIIALLLSLVGVPRDVIVEDYTGSNIYLQPIYDAWLNEKSRTQAEIDGFHSWAYAPAGAMLGALDHLDEQYGGVEAYLLGAGVTREELARIKERLRE